MNNYQVSFNLENLVVKDPVKRVFELITKTRFEVWLEQTNLELRAHGLLDLTGTLAFPFRNFSEAENLLYQGYACDIFLQRVDDTYKHNLVDLVDPKDLMSRVKQIKYAETSCNPNTIIGKLLSLIYEPSRESAAEFNAKFVELIQKHNNIELIPKLSDRMQVYVL